MKNEIKCGLVVCGGESSRMGKDKAFIEYHGEPQVYHVYHLLQSFCTEVFIACSDLQMPKIDNRFKKMIDDNRYKNKGPSTALLTATAKLPEKNFIVLGCDYPFITVEDLSSFISTIDSDTTAAAFFNIQSNLYEPLLAYYSWKAAKQFAEENERSPVSLQNFLACHEAIKYYPHNTASLESIDTPAQETNAREILRHLQSHNK